MSKLLLTVSMWAIWSARRKAIHEEIYQSPLYIHGFINSYLEELNGLSKPGARGVSTASYPGAENPG
jgi:hypothetical protein